jgi:hypothetical protein
MQREPWVLSAALSPRPLPRRAGEGEQKGVGVVILPGLRSCEEIEICHAERSEASLQLFVNS